MGPILKKSKKLIFLPFLQLNLRWAFLCVLAKLYSRNYKNQNAKTQIKRLKDLAKKAKVM